MFNALNIIQCANLGGMERVAERMMRLLTLCKWHIISLNTAGPGRKLFEGGTLRFTDLEYSRWTPWNTVLPIRRIVESERPDLLVMTGHNALAAVALSRRDCGRSVLWLHYHHRGVKSWVGWRLVYRQALSKFHTLIFASDFIRQEAISIEPLVEARSFVVHSPLDVNNLATPAQKCAARRKLGLPEDCTVIGNAGWLIHRKRFDIFLAVIKQLVGNGKEVVACIAGNGPLEHELRLEAEALGVAKCVRFLGLVSDMEMFYQSIDVLLFNSDWDCFPTTPLESMAYGIPTIASCLNSGLSEIFDDQLLERFYLDEHHIGKLSTRVWECTQTANLGIAQRRRVAEMLDPVRQSTKFWSVLSGNREL